MKTCDPRGRLMLWIVLLALGGSPLTGAPPGWSVATPDYEWAFPRDHWSHPGYKLEWWYFTGHLESTALPARSFGYQVTIFRIGLHPEALGYDSAWTAAHLLMGHVAVTDKQAQSHTFSEVLYRASDLLAGFGEYPDSEIAWSRAPVGTEGRWSLRWNGEAFDFTVIDDRKGITLDLVTRPLKPLIFQGPNGFSRKSEVAGAASQYYSLTRLDTSGSLTLGGERLEVRGQSWMDKEFSTSNLADEQVGWDWFSLQLDDGRELMLYVLRGPDGAFDFGRGTVVGPEGRVRWLDPSEWSWSVTGRWTSPRTGSEYPSGWTIELPSEKMDLVVRPDVEDQENVGELAGGLHYWEGAVTVLDGAGRRIGRGYVELTGYGKGNRPPV